jgi:hypothetical protein
MRNDILGVELACTANGFFVGICGQTRCSLWAIVRLYTSDINNNFANIGEQKLEIVWAFNSQNFERSRKFCSEFFYFC